MPWRIWKTTGHIPHDCVLDFCQFLQYIGKKMFWALLPLVRFSDLLCFLPCCADSLKPLLFSSKPNIIPHQSCTEIKLGCSTYIFSPIVCFYVVHKILNQLDCWKFLLQYQPIFLYIVKQCVVSRRFCHFCTLGTTATDTGRNFSPGGKISSRGKQFFN